MNIYKESNRTHSKDWVKFHKLSPLILGSTNFSMGAKEIGYTLRSYELPKFGLSNHINEF